MACQLTVLAQFSDLRAVKKFLFPEARLEATKKDDFDGGWDEGDWGWKDDSGDELGDGAGTDPVAQSWLQNCHLSLSPAGDVMAVARETRLVLLQQKWDPMDDTAQCRYSTVYEGVVAQEPGEKITCVFCLPLASQKKSNQGGPDWTCTILGFNSGYMRIFTENGTLLLSQIFSEERVVCIKCHTFTPPRHISDCETLEELSILYSHSLVTIDGFSFFQSLKACKNQVARATASGNEAFQPPPLAYKKWALHNQDTITDYSPSGLVTPNVFDQMKTDSLNIGPHARVKGNPSASHLYITTGMGPYTGFYYTLQGGSQPLLSDVAHAVATKLKTAFLSAASGWLGLGGSGAAKGGKGGSEQTAEKRKPKIEPATSLPARFGLFDKRRSGESVVASPDGQLVATTDSFGRVILVDKQRGVALRMWKGYRDAQVGWVEAGEDGAGEGGETPGTGVARKAAFLVIYAPRRGILEVWGTQHGPRVAAFSVSRSCRLVSRSYGVLGLNSVTYEDCRVISSSVCLFDSDGTLRTINVPFHLSLSDKNSKRARDMHLLKQLKLLLKDHSSDTESLRNEVISTLLDMKTLSIVRQGLERVLTTLYVAPEFLSAVVSSVRNQLTTQQSEGKDRDADVAVDFESRSLVQFCLYTESLIKVYSDLLSMRHHVTSHAPSQQDPPSNHCVDQEKLIRELCDTGIVSPEDAQELTSVVHRYRNISASSTVIGDKLDQPDTDLPIVDFIGYFECQTVRTGSEKNEKLGESQGELSFVATVVPSLSESKKTKLARFMFEVELRSGRGNQKQELEEEAERVGGDRRLLEVLEESKIPAQDLMSLVLQLWLQEERSGFSSLSSLQSLVRDIHRLHKRKRKQCDEIEKEELQEGSKEPKLWLMYRDTCGSSNNIASALLLALVGRSVACRNNKKKKKCDTSVGDGRLKDEVSDDELVGWESITLDRENWDLLIKQLEDLLVLQCLLKMKPQGVASKPCITWEAESIPVSLKRVLEGGKGVIPELVGKWLSGHGVPPCMLCQREEDVQTAAAAAAQVSAKLKNSKLSRLAQMRTRSMSVSCNPLIAQLQEVQWRLPHTLDSDVLLSNCAWEYIVIWNRDPESIYPLEQSLAYLKCVQNALLQHGVAVMIWQMFMIKRLSSAALLVEKVGKCPKDRLCRKEVGLSDISLGKFMSHCVTLLEIIAQATADSHELPLFDVEVAWAGAQGPTPLVELAVEQREANPELVLHHLALCLVLQAVLTFNMKSIKPLYLFGRKGASAFFKPLHSLPLLSDKVVDDAVANSRKQFLHRVITESVQLLVHDTSSTEKPLALPSSGSPSVRFLSSSPHQLLPAGLTTAELKAYSCWPTAAGKLAAGSLAVDEDELRVHHATQLYRCGLDTLADQVLLTVSDRSSLGIEMLRVAGMRLAQIVFSAEAGYQAEKLSQCSTRVSTYLKSLDPSDLSGTTPPLSSTLVLLTNVASLIPEGQSEYDLALELIDLAQGLS